MTPWVTRTTRMRGEIVDAHLDKQYLMDIFDLRATTGPNPSLGWDKPELQNVLNLNACLGLVCSDAIVSQVLDELGLNMSDELSSKKIALFFR